MESLTYQNTGERIKLRRKQLGWSQSQLAEKLGVVKQTVIRYEKGEGLDNRSKVNEIEAVLSLEHGTLIDEEAISSTVPLVGYVGAGAIIIPIDDHAKGAALEEIRAPQGLNLYGYVAVRVKGDSMYPRYFEGEVIAFKREIDWSDDYINHECVVKLRDGSMYVKTIRAGSKKGFYRLDSFNAPPIEDVEIEWACNGLIRL